MISNSVLQATDSIQAPLFHCRLQLLIGHFDDGQAELKGQEVQQEQEELEGLQVFNLPQLLLCSASSSFQVVYSPSLKSCL